MHSSREFSCDSEWRTSASGTSSHHSFHSSDSTLRRSQLWASEQCTGRQWLHTPGNPLDTPGPDHNAHTDRETVRHTYRQVICIKTKTGVNIHFKAEMTEQPLVFVACHDVKHSETYPNTSFTSLWQQSTIRVDERVLVTSVVRGGCGCFIPIYRRLYQHPRSMGETHAHSLTSLTNS